MVIYVSFPKDFKEKKEISFSSLKEISFVSSKDTEKEMNFKETKETPTYLNWFLPRPQTSQPPVARSVEFSRRMEENRNSPDKIAETLGHMEGRLGELKDEKVELDACCYDFR